MTNDNNMLKMPIDLKNDFNYKKNYLKKFTKFFFLPEKNLFGEIRGIVLTPSIYGIRFIGIRMHIQKSKLFFMITRKKTYK